MAFTTTATTESENTTQEKTEIDISSSSCCNDTSIPLLDDEEELLQHGIVRVPIPEWFDCDHFADALSTVTPMILTANDEDHDGSFYRNILEEPDFPFERLLQDPAIASAVHRHFGIAEISNELRLDDGFCISMDANLHDETKGAKHQDPSDITINMCLKKTAETKGSHVLFYGKEALVSADDETAAEGNNDGSNQTDRDQQKRFLVNQRPGYCTLHWGRHPHETTAMTETGLRTNVILTYCYTDPSRSDVATRNCYYNNTS